jgi:hypothetical protein
VTHRILIMIAAGALAACSKSDDPPKTAPPSETDGVESAPAAAAASSDPCALVENAEAILGQPVTAERNTNPNNTLDCQWKAADGRLCGSLTVFGPGYNETAADAKTNYGALTTSLKAFGQTWDVAGVGEEAQAVDGGMLGAQLAFRKGSHSALVGSACKAGADGAPGLAEKLAREVAGRL